MMGVCMAALALPRRARNISVTIYNAVVCRRRPDGCTLHRLEKEYSQSTQKEHVTGISPHGSESCCHVHDTQTNYNEEGGGPT